LGQKFKRFPPYYSRSPLHLCLEIYISSTHATSYSFYSSVIVHCRGERRKTKSEKSQDCAQKPQRNCKFMNSASVQAMVQHSLIVAQNIAFLHCGFYLDRTNIERITGPTLQGKSHLCIPFLGIAQHQSQFPHSCVCERFTYIPLIGPHISQQQNRQIDPGNM